jgi:hypothetical protein
VTEEKEDANMRARAPLMIEHRLIERMISHIKDALVQIESTHKEDQAMLAEFHSPIIEWLHAADH